MNRKIRLTLPFILLLFCSQYENTAAQKNPLNSSAKLVKRMTVFSDIVSSDPTFTSEQIGDLYAILKGLINMTNELDRSGMMNQARLQAIRKALIASIAEIVVIEGNASLYQKTNAVLNDMRTAFLKTMGTVPEIVITETRELINMFARDMSGSGALSANDMGPSGQGQNSYGEGAALSGQEQYGSGAASASAAVGTVEYGTGPGFSVPSGGPGFGPSGLAIGPSVPGVVQPGQGPYGSSVAYGTSSAVASTSSVSGPYGPTGTGPTGLGTIQPGVGPYGPTAAYGASSALAAGVALPYGTDSEQSGLVTGQSGPPVDRSLVSNSISRLSSSSSSARVSSAVSTLISSGGFNPSSLGGVIADLSNSLSLSQPGLSGCEALVQVLLEVITSLVHILSSSSVGQLSSSPAASSSLVGQSIFSAFGG